MRPRGLSGTQVRACSGEQGARWLLCAAVLASALAASGAFADEGTVLHAQDVFDGERLLHDAYVTVDGNRITSIGASRPKGKRTVVELGRCTLMPGLIDTHVHILSNGVTSLEEARLSQLGQSSAAKALIGLRSAQTLLEAGFTTLRVPGDFDRYSAQLAVRDAIDAGLFHGPKIFAAGRFITRTGGHYDDNWVATDQHILGSARVADGADALRVAVREEIKAGADWIKVGASGGFTTPRSLPNVATFTDEELKAIVGEAHRLGARVAAHAFSRDALESVIRAGVDSVEHGLELTPAMMREMAKRRIYWVPTWYPAESEAEPEEKWLPAWRASEYTKSQRQMLRAAQDAKVDIAFGTESGLFPHGHNARQLLIFVECGMKPLQAIQSATVIAARMLGIPNGGRVVPGAPADLIAVPSNPLQDIRALNDVRFVMRAGAVVVNRLSTP